MDVIAYAASKRFTEETVRRTESGEYLATEEELILLRTELENEVGLKAESSLVGELAETGLSDADGVTNIATAIKKVDLRAKEYTDEQIEKLSVAEAISVDEKPVYTNDGAITYIKDGETFTLEKGYVWFYYYDEEGSLVQTIWIDETEYTLSVGDIDLTEYIKKTSIIMPKENESDPEPTYEPTDIPSMALFEQFKNESESENTGSFVVKGEFTQKKADFTEFDVSVQSSYSEVREALNSGSFVYCSMMCGNLELIFYQCMIVDSFTIDGSLKFATAAAMDGIPQLTLTLHADGTVYMTAIENESESENTGVFVATGNLTESSDNNIVVENFSATFDEIASAFESGSLIYCNLSMNNKNVIFKSSMMSIDEGIFKFDANIIYAGRQTLYNLTVYAHGVVECIPTELNNGGEGEEAFVITADVVLDLENDAYAVENVSATYEKIVAAFNEGISMYCIINFEDITVRLYTTGLDQESTEFSFGCIYEHGSIPTLFTLRFLPTGGVIVNINRLERYVDSRIDNKIRDLATNETVDTAKENAVETAKQYTDESIEKINTKEAIFVDAKPTYQDGIITYIKGGVEQTTTDVDMWFYYFNEDNLAVQTIWIDDTEITIDVAGIDLTEYISEDDVSYVNPDTEEQTFEDNDVATMGMVKYAIESSYLSGELKWITGKHEDFGGWLLCDGRELLKSDYPTLFETIGHSFGVPTDVGTSFLLPDARGKVIGMGNDTYPIGTTHGSETVQILRDHLPDYSLWVGYESAGTPEGTVTVNTNYPMGSSSYYVPYSNSSWEKDGGGNVEGSGGNYPKQDNSGAVNSTNLGHNHTASFVGKELNTHNHAVWLDGKEEPLPIMQPTLFIGNLFIHI